MNNLDSEAAPLQAQPIQISHAQIVFDNEHPLPMSIVHRPANFQTGTYGRDRCRPRASSEYDCHFEMAQVQHILARQTNSLVGYEPGAVQSAAIFAAQVFIIQRLAIAVQQTVPPRNAHFVGFIRTQIEAGYFCAAVGGTTQEYVTFDYEGYTRCLTDF